MTTLATQLAVTTALALMGGAQAAPKVSPACAAAEAALPHLSLRGGDPLLFSTELPPKWNGTFAGVREGRSGISVGSQPTAALALFDHTKLGPALACANVRAWAEALGEVVEEAAGDSRVRSMGLNGKTAYLWRVAMPVLDRSGTQAVVAAYATSNQLAGGSELVFLTRQPDGAWKVTGGRVLTMS